MLTQTDNRGLSIARIHADADAQPHARKQTNKQTEEIQRQIEKHTHTHTQMRKNTLSAQHTLARGLRGRTLTACQKSVISCLEDVKAWARFVTFVAAARRISPSLEKMINFCYLHYCPEGSSIGLTHLSFPLHCFSNGNEIECTASWVSPRRDSFKEEKEKKRERKKVYLLIIKQPCQHGTAAVAQCSLLALVNSEIILRATLPPLPNCSCLIRALIGWAQSINQP